MFTTLTRGRAARTLTAVLFVGAAAGALTACQSPDAAVRSVVIERQHANAPDARLSQRFAGVPADRAEATLRAEAIERARDFGACARHVVVLHDGGGDHLACVAIWDD